MSLSSKSVFVSLQWSTIDYVSKQLLQLVTTIILARFLSPSDFGLIGMTLVVIGFVAIFKDLGTAAAVIQITELSDSLLSSIFWVNLAFGMVVTLIIFFMAPLVANLYREAEIISLLEVVSLTFFISSLSILQQTLLQKQLLFDKLAKINIVSTIAGSVAGITAAVYGVGAMSLVYQSLAMAVLSALLLWISTDWRPKLVVDWQELKSIQTFSLNLAGYNIFNYLARNVDYLLIGRFLGSEALGYYTLAYQLMLYPVQIVSSVVSRVMYPAYAQLQHDNVRLGRIYLRMVSSIALITFPVMIGMGLVSDSIISTFFGSPWKQSAAVLLILAPVGLLQSINTTVSTIYQSKGRTDWMFRWSIASSVIRTVAFAIGLSWGIRGVAIAYAISTYMLLYYNFAIPFSLIQLKVSQLLRILRVPIQYSLIMSLGVVLSQTLFHIYGVDHPYLLLSSSIAAGLGVYTGLLLINRPPMFVDAVQILPIRLPAWVTRTNGS